MNFHPYRYSVVMNPFCSVSSSKVTWRKIILTWMLGMTLGIPSALLYQFRWIKDNINGIKPYCSARYPSFKLLHLRKDKSLSNTFVTLDGMYSISFEDFYTFSLFVYQFLIPLMFLAFTYVKMSFKLSEDETLG